MILVKRSMIRVSYQTLSEYESSLWDFDNKLLKMIGESLEVVDAVNHQYKI